MTRPCPDPHPAHKPGYHRRRPEQTVLHDALRRHMETFLEAAEADPERGGLPAHVRGEMERFLGCGILAHGFCRVRCPRCEDDLLGAAGGPRLVLVGAA